MRPYIKFLITYLLFILIISKPSIVVGQQQCLTSGYCSNLQTRYPSCTSVYTTASPTTWTVVGTVFWGGDYAVFDVVQGSTYEWSTCNKFGGIQANDVQLTLKDINNNNLCFSDNSNSPLLPTCPNAPYISWTATFTGQVKVLVTVKIGSSSCQATSSGDATLVWRRTNTCSTPSTPSGFSSSSTSSSITLTWNPISGASKYLIYDCNDCDNYLGPVLTNSYTISSGLQPNSSYSLKVMAVVGICNSNKSSCQTITTQSLCTSPTTQSSNISFTNISQNQLTVNWSNGNGSRRVVYANTINSFSSPSSGSDPNYNQTYGGSGQQVIYNGTNNNVTVFGLIQNTTYYFRVYEANCSGSSSVYNNSSTSNNPNSQTTTQNCTSPTIISHPSNSTINSGGNTSFGVFANGTSLNYQWQISTNNGNSYNTLNDGGYYSNTTTSVLNIFGALTSINGYKYRCIVTASCNGSSIVSNPASLFVNSPQPPVADFTISNNNPTSGTQVQFFDKSSNNPTSWSWTANGGTPYETHNGSLPNPKITFINPGQYKVALIATNSAGNSTPKVKTITVLPSLSTVAPQPPKSVTIDPTFPQQPIQEPIQLGTATYEYRHTDFTLPVINGSISLTRYYNSYNSTKNGSFGYGWSFSPVLYVQNSDTLWNVFYPDGHSRTFVPLTDSSGLSFPLYAGTYDSLVKVSSGEFWMYSKEKNIYKFTATGRLYEIDDTNGNQTIFSYTANNLTQILGAGGRTFTLSYDDSNRISSVQINSGRVCHYGYDANGNLSLAISARGDTTKYDYDSSHLMLLFVNPLGDTVISNSYDATHQIYSQADANKKNTTIVYNSPNTGDATVTFPDTSTMVYHHDESYRLTKSIDALGKVKTIIYDANNNPDTVINEKNQSTFFQYDSKGNPVLQTLSGGRTYISTFNQFSKPTQITNPRGYSSFLNYDTVTGNLLSINLADSSWRYFAYNTNGTIQFYVNGNKDTTNYTYNSFGDIIQITTPTGVKYFGYDVDGRLDSITDENHHLTLITYDSSNNIVSITDALHQSLYFKYDANNQLIIFTDKMGYSTNFYYDKKGRMIARKNAMQGVDSFYYDVQDRLTAKRDALGHFTRYAYDSNGRKISKTTAAGITKYQPDEIGNVTKITDPNNHNLDIVYNASNEIQTITDSLNNLVSMLYDSSGNIKTYTNYRNKSTNYLHDQVNRLSTVIDVDNISTIYSHDFEGNMTSLTDGKKHTQNFEIGKSNRLKIYTDAAKNPYQIIYDSVGNVITTIKPLGSITNIYDPLNRLTKVTLTSGDVYNYTYNANNKITSINNNKGTSYFYYDSLNRMIRYLDLFGQQVLYGYNAVGSITYIVYPNLDSVNYTYDDANRLKTVTDWKHNVFTYSYDSVGNVKKLLYPNGVHCDYKYDAVNRLVSKFTFLQTDSILYGQQYTYLNDSIKEIRYGSYPKGLSDAINKYDYRADDALLGSPKNPCVVDSNGNRIREIHNTNTTTYHYTTDQLLSSYVKKGVTTTVGYDALGHRVSRVKAVDETRYVLSLNSPLSLVLQTNDANNNIRNRYIYGLGLLEQIDSTNNESYYHFDTRHNTIAITDKNDSIKAAYTYLLKGLITEHTGTLKQPFTFLGEFGVEQETDSCYYIRARYYDASVGVFLSKDPLFGDAFEPQSLNRYSYAMNDQLTAYDISGLTKADDVGNSIEATSSVANLIDALNTAAESKNGLTQLSYSFKIYAEDFGKTFSGINALRIFEVADYTKKLDNFYSEVQNEVNDFMDYKITSTEFLEKVMLSTGKVLPYTSGLISMNEEVTKLTNDFMDYKISKTDYFLGIFNSSMNAFLPGWNQLNNLSNKILNGYMNGVNYVGDKIGNLLVKFY